ncbi:hypothetical protein PGT21_014977 [Puccinia graminis f. sp. tritici]|uniref:Uncharacterized protein n=1 Tax=Puccinia graminis f. sp. tritici TaxID=56615 RepID=A0A5B0LV04_PUCGR|nr:hypothetical protein PGT21_014977 [Puccinia graminis f. sp. tritici]
MTRPQKKVWEHSERRTSSCSNLEIDGTPMGERSSEEVSALDQLAKDLPPVLALSPYERLRIMNNWRMNQEHVIPLYKDSKDLLNIHSEIQDQLEWMKETNQVQNKQEFSMVIDLVRKSQETISMFKQLKMFELGQVDLKIFNQGMMTFLFAENELCSQVVRHAKDGYLGLFGQISKRAWQNFAHMFLNEVKKMILDNSNQFKNLKML